LHIVIDDYDRRDEVLNLIHDNWFGEENIMFIPQTSILEIKSKRESDEFIEDVYFLKKYRRSFFESILRIHNVESYQITDIAKIGGSTFNEIIYDGKEKITITCGIPFRIDIKVNSFRIEVEETGKLLEEKEFLSLF
jgi:hypothetical protein